MKYIFLLISCFGSFFAFAQSELPEGFGDYRTIPNIKPSFYTQAFIPPTFKKKVWRDSILLLENNRHLIQHLKKEYDYEIVTIVINVYPSYVMWEFEEPKIDTTIESKTIIVDRICEEIKPMPEYEGEIIQERFMALPFYLKYTTTDPTGKEWKDIHNYGYHPKNAVIVSIACLEGGPKYGIIRKKVFREEEKWWTETIEDTIIVKRLIENIGKYTGTKKIIPPKLDTLEMIVFYENSLIDLKHPIFSTIYQNVLEKEGYFTNWVRPLRPTHYNGNVFVIKKIQEALVKKGYTVTVNNIFDAETKATLIQFQKDNNLPVGQLDTETLKALGLE